MQPPNTVGRWSIATGQAGTEAEAARAELGSVHWYPVYAYLRAAGFDAEAGAARTDSVLARFIDDPPPSGNRTLLLRDWLRTLAAEAVTEQTLREAVLKIPRAWAANRYSQETARPPEETFARRWTLGLVEGALAMLEHEYRACDQGELFAAAQQMLGFSGGAQGDENYAMLAGKLGMSSSAARKAVFELRARYHQLLQAAIADTVAHTDQISGELSLLLVELPPPAATAPPPSALHRVNPEELLARGKNPVKMSTAGGLGWTPPTVAEAARLFPGYEVVAILGHGGMGAVYEARQTSLDRLVAIKLLPLEISVDPNFAERFRREARAMAKLNHPNIISVHDFGQTREGHLFFVMEFVDGAMLHDLIHQRAGGITPADSLAVVEQVCDALAYAHEQGVVHRDIKPANVMIDRRMRAKVADFGLARLTNATGADEWGATMTGIVMGTPDYMAPEQKRGQQVDHRADIFSLGVMLYEMLCKETPQGAFDLASKRCGIDPRIDTIIGKALATQPERRYQNTLELKRAVQTVRTNLQAPPPAKSPVPIAAPKATPGPKVAPLAIPPARSKGFAVGAVLAATLALITGVGFWLAREKQPKLTQAELAERAARNGANLAKSSAAGAGASTDAAMAAPARDTRAFNGHRYRLIPGVMDWEVARATAEKMGGHLAVITTREENDWIAQTFLRENTRFWLGAQRSADGEWKWVNGEPWEFTAWARSTDGKSEPSGVSPDGEAETVLEMASYGTMVPPGGWNDRASTARTGAAVSDGFLVEWSAGATATVARVRATPAKAPELPPPAASTPLPAASEPPAPTPAPTPAPEAVAISPVAMPQAAAEVAQWIAENEATFAAQWQKEAIEPFEAAVTQLRAAYIAGVERGVATESKAGRLDDALAWQNEKARLESGQVPHEIADEPKEPQSLRQFRQNWRKNYARLDGERFARAKAVHARFDALLEKAQLGYTQRQRFHDALLTKAKREEIAQAWLSPAFDLSQGTTRADSVASTLSPAPTSEPKPEGQLSGREAVLLLRDLGFQITYREADGANKVIAQDADVQSIPSRGRFDITILQAQTLRRFNGGGSVTDADFEKLAPIRTLRQFQIRAAPALAGSGLAFLGGAPDLEYLTLRTNGLSPAAFAPILGHRKIRILEVVPSAGMDYSTLADAAFLDELVQLALGGMTPEDGFVAAVPKLRKVRNLRIENGGALNAAACAAFASLPNLESAHFGGLSKNGMQGVAELEKASKVTRLELVSCDARDSLAFIARMRKLEYLHLDAEDAPSLAKAAGAPALRAISFSDAGGGAGNEGLHAIAKAFPRLESLSFGANTSHNITAEGVKALASLARLTSLTWGKKPITAENLAAIAELPQIETLDLSKTSLKDADLAPLAASNSITTLVLNENASITPRCAEVLKAMPKLRSLRLSKSGVKTAEIPGMQRTLTRVAITVD